MDVFSFTKELLITKRKIHLIGVAGSGMSGLAHLLLDMGHDVSGSDKNYSAEIGKLKQKGLLFFPSHQQVTTADIDLFVFSSAIRSSNILRKYAVEKGVLLLHRAECLAAILKQKPAVLIAGMHGKTTTSALVAYLFNTAAALPSYYIGAEIPLLGSNASWQQQGDVMIAEGDESDGSLVNYQPEQLVILNIEEEHLDYYRDGITAIKQTFQQVIAQTNKQIIYYQGCPHARDLCEKLPQSISFGFEHSDYEARNIVTTKGNYQFDIYKYGKLWLQSSVHILGEHNILNVLAAAICADLYCVPAAKIATALPNFIGAKRRFETILYQQNLRIVDDYGHHPTEIKATISTAQQLKPQRLVIVFQPHRYSRTQAFFDDFVASLSHADKVYILPVYAANEVDNDGKNALDLVDACQQKNTNDTTYLPDFNTAHYLIGNQIQEGDLIITLGAGNVHLVGKKIARDASILEQLKTALKLQNVPFDNKHYTLYQPMARKTTIRVGGPAQWWIEPSTVAELAIIIKFAQQQQLPLYIIGRGSNLIVQQGGVPGIVVCPKHGEFNEISLEEGNLIRAGVGVKYKKLTSFAVKHQIAGLEWMEGVPGNIGGSLRMNAGAMGAETFDHVVSVTWLDQQGNLVCKQRQDIASQYRSVEQLKSVYCVSAVFQGKQAANQYDMLAVVDLCRQKRRSSQPKEASAGCIFKNPSADLSAGKLIELLGLKGTSIGGAQISTIHGNFIINTGTATASDVLQLIHLVQQKALQQKQITLVMEAQVVGVEEITF